MTYDLVIHGGLIIDGTGRAPFRGDVGIRAGKIAAVGPIGSHNAPLIQAKDLVIAPGFIDTHTHSDFPLVVDPRAESQVRQGVTTEVIGNCGHSCAPVRSEFRQDLQRAIFGYVPGFDLHWETFKQYLDVLDAKELGHNIVPLVGHGALRIAVMGFENRPASSGELREMEGLAEEAFESGVYGLSTGLAYAPGSYATTDEIVKLAKVAHRAGGIYATHVRSYTADHRLPAIHEAIEIGQKSGAPVHLSHHSASGNATETLRIVEQARYRGQDITYDLHPYLWATSTLTALLPRSMLAGGVQRLKARLDHARRNHEFSSWQIPFPRVTWDTIVLENASSNHSFIGQSIRAIADRWQLAPWEAVMKLLIDEDEDQLYGVYMRFALYDEADVVAILQDPHAMVGSDGMALSPSGPLASIRFHPRSYGTYPKILREFVQERGLLTLEEAIRKMTSVPAQRFGLADRGLIRPGWHADIVAFDLSRVRDRATYEQPNVLPEGIEYVLVNGRPVVQDGELTGAGPGRVLRRARRAAVS